MSYKNIFGLFLGFDGDSNMAPKHFLRIYSRHVLAEVTPFL